MVILDKIQIFLFIIIIYCNNVTIFSQDLIADTLRYTRNQQWEEAEKCVNIIDNNIIKKIVLSQKYLDCEHNNNSFKEIIEFIKANPNWPQKEQLIQNAEKFLNYNTSEKEIFDWFSKNEPKTDIGYKFYALASYKYINEYDLLLPIIKKGWIYGSFDTDETNNFLQQFCTILSNADHVEKIDQLLIKKDIDSAKKLLHLVDNKYKQNFYTQISIINNDTNIDKIFKNVQSKYYTTGLLLNYLSAQKYNIRNKQIIKLFNAIPQNTLYAHELWKLQEFYARKFINQKKFSYAYKILQIKLANNNYDISEQEFLLGWIALQLLNKPDIALKHFKKFHNIVSKPISISKSYYWIGRTYEKLNKKKLSLNMYNLGSQYYYTFYGQLSMIKLNKKFILFNNREYYQNTINSKLIPKTDLMKATEILIKYNEVDLAIKYIKKIIFNTLTADEIKYIVNIIGANSYPYYLVEIGKIALSKNNLLKDFLFPTPYFIMESNIEYALIYSVIKQESVFHYSAVSNAKAMGLMQLIESTACDMAKSMNITCNIQELTSNPYYNIKLGSNYLRTLLKIYDNSYLLAIASYNAGIGKINNWIKTIGDPRKMQNLDKIIDWLELIPYAETRNYLQRVLENMQIYRIILNNNNQLYLKRDLLFITE